jgi:hypothetical protein
VHSSQEETGTGLNKLWASRDWERDVIYAIYHTSILKMLAF